MSYRNKIEIVQAALNLVASTPVPASSTIQSPEIQNGLSRLTRITGEECEAFTYPFAVQYFRLANPRVESLNYQAEENVVYTLPDAVASIIGVFNREDLPGLTNITSGVSSYYKYDMLAGSQIRVSPVPEEGKEVYLVYMTRDPIVANMFASFQNLLVYLLATEFHMTVGTNSRILMSLKMDANKSRRVARETAVNGFSNAVRIFVTIDDVLQNGQPNGGV